MSTAEIVNALGPGSRLSKLAQFSSSYSTVTENFNKLLLYPFLQSIVLSDPENKKLNDEDLRTIVVDGNSRFGQLCTSNISIAQQVNSYGKAVPVLLKSLTIGKYAISTKPLIGQYVAEAEASSGDNKEFFEEFQTYLSTLDEQIALMASNVSDLTSQIEKASGELANANVGRVIGDLIKSLFKTATGEEGDIQTATLLNVGIETLKSSFTQLWKDQQRLKDLIKGLTALKDNLTAIKKLFSALSKALTGVISDAQSLLLTWSDVQARLGEVETIDRKVTDTESKQIVTAWTKAQEAATAYVDVVSGSGSKPPVRALFAAASAALPNHMPKVPRTQGELKMARLLTSIASTHSKVAHHSAIENFRAENDHVTDSDKEKVLEAAGPPSETQAILDEAILQTSGVMQQFNDLLEIPFLNQLQCNNPDKPSEKIDIQTMVKNYQKMYWDLQQDTVPLAQDLQTYSKTVLLLLPKLVSTSSAKPGQVTVASYLSAHQALAADYHLQADAIFNRSLTYKNLWDNAIIAVKQAINECKTNITTWESTIDDLNEEIKKLTLKAVLMGVGALLCFAAAAFLPGGSIALIGMTISAIQQIGKLRETINDLKGKIEIAKDTQEKLEYLLPFMVKISQSLTDIAAVWKDITQGLNDIEAWNSLLITPSLLDIVRPELLTSWTGIRDATQRYMDIIVGQPKV
ncbi:hypothetical protein B0H19DRAFT_1026798 [Mycena capillaripes]|nr:hypothetical protein B0H19DRAFT_1026798 [Mycena capillaripes]